MWNWLNGKKTAIGAALLWPEWAYEQIVDGIWGYSDVLLSNSVESAGLVGFILTTGGLTHKGIKLYQDKKGGQ